MNKPKLLYIDDERINLLAFRAQFRRKFEVFCTHNADSVWEILEQQSIDFVFSDQRMPYTTGVEILALVKKLQPAAKRAIISGFTEDTRIQEGLRSGVVQKIFAKPYKVPEIMRYIGEHIQLGDET